MSAILLALVLLLVSANTGSCEGVKTINPIVYNFTKSVGGSLGGTDSGSSGSIKTINPDIYGFTKAVGESLREDDSGSDGGIKTIDSDVYEFTKNVAGALGSMPGGTAGSSEGNQATSAEPVAVTEDLVEVYVSGELMPLSSFLIPGNNYLWIERDLGWSQYASINQNDIISLIAFVPMGGQGEVYELFPSASPQGAYYRQIYMFSSGYNRLYFKGAMPGRYLLTFSLYNQPSNSVIIDVIGIQPLGTGSPLILGTAPGSQ